MAQLIDHLAILGQGHIGSSITRAVAERQIARAVTVTDVSPKVRSRILEIGIGQAKVVDTSAEAVANADVVIACVPVGELGALAQEIGPHLKPGAIVSDVGSVKGPIVREMRAHLPASVHLVPGHPLAGTEFSGPDSGLPKLFVDRWCILTPPENTDPSAVECLKEFWKALGSEVEIMTPDHHDHVLAITSHLPHAIAFTIFHTALAYEATTNSEVMKFSAGGFRDFTRIASSNPTMWRDIFLKNKEAVLDILKQFNNDFALLAQAIEAGDGDKLFQYFSTSRQTRRRVIEKEHISVLSENKKKMGEGGTPLLRPYAWND